MREYSSPIHLSRVIRTYLCKSNPFKMQVTDTADDELYKLRRVSQVHQYIRYFRPSSSAKVMELAPPYDLVITAICRSVKGRRVLLYQTWRELHRAEGPGWVGT